MRKEGDSEMRDEYDFTNAVRAKHAARMTVRERGELLRRSAVQDVQTWISHALTEVQALEAAFFSYLVLTRNQPPEHAGALAAAALGDREPGMGSESAGPDAFGLPGAELEERWSRLSGERQWLVHRSGIEGQDALSHHERIDALRGRLARIADDAAAVKAQMEEIIRRHLSRTGLSKQEIDAKTGETKQLWLAA